MLYGSKSLTVEDKPQWNCHLFTVLTSNIATVIGPTPPGTGVIALTLEATSLALTSPQSLNFDSIRFVDVGIL
jgi:hypothetical protein